MNISDKGLELIKAFEQLVLHSYKDSVGVSTTGYGTTRYPDGRRVTMQDPPITKEQATEYLIFTINQMSQEVAGMVTATLNQNQIDAILSFCYNVGTAAFQGSTLRKRINSSPSDPSIRDAFLMWDKAHKDGQLIRLPGLTRRRKAEASLYFS